jgi:ADP-heptose:LPS heptosyltransferase
LVKERVMDGVPAGYLRLSRSISWQHQIPGGRHYVFLRGKVEPIATEHEYDYLLRQGWVEDPYKHLNEITIETLPRLRPGSEVIIFRNIGLGDVILVAAVVRELPRLHPHLRFSFATISRHIPLFEGVPWISQVYQISNMRGHFPAVIDLRGFAERHPQKYDHERIDLYSRYLLGYVPDKYEFDVPMIRDDEREWARGLLREVPRPWVVFAVKSTTTHLRSLPDDQVGAVTAQLMKRGAGVVHIHPSPLDWPCSLNLTGALTVRQLAALTDVADCVISPDTGLYHLAEAVRTPHVDLFSTWPPDRRVGHYKYAFPIWKGASVACCPCFDKRPGCKSLDCFRAMSTEEIVERVYEACDLKVNDAIKEEEMEWATQ